MPQFSASDLSASPKVIYMKHWDKIMYTYTHSDTGATNFQTYLFIQFEVPKVDFHSFKHMASFTQQNTLVTQVGHVLILLYLFIYCYYCMHH
jgi:hypothetical protein